MFSLQRKPPTAHKSMSGSPFQALTYLDGSAPVTGGNWEVALKANGDFVQPQREAKGWFRGVNIGAGVEVPRSAYHLRCIKQV
jgi:hypothetical protein